MRDYISIASAPVDEPCAQVGSKNYDYYLVARAECHRFKELLIETFGEPPMGASLKVKGNPHDFGTYYDVVCWYDDAYPEAVTYAFKLEGETPQTWPPKYKKIIKELYTSVGCNERGEKIPTPTKMTHFSHLGMTVGDVLTFKTKPPKRWDEDLID